MKRPSGLLPADHSGDDDEFGMEEGDVVKNKNKNKKRRLRTEQVRALERSFETENKLEPERKARLARELGLQPRQVAVWFQNRRARWKTKQLERDYAALRHSYDALQAEIKELKAKLGDEGALSSEPAAMGSSDSDSSGVVNDAEKPPTATTLAPQLKVVEEEAAAPFLGDDDDDAECGGFFADLQPPPSLPWWTEPTDNWA